MMDNLVRRFTEWEHTVIQRANKFNLVSYLKEKDIIKRLVKENFDKQEKIPKNNMLNTVDSYTQK